MGSVSLSVSGNHEHSQPLDNRWAICTLSLR